MRNTASTIREGNLLPLAMDLGNLSEVQKVGQAFVARETRLDILVNNAGL
jgi:NADP-dependent 3-hydroxy acid dehydrogenase YdfG